MIWTDKIERWSCDNSDRERRRAEMKMGPITFYDSFMHRIIQIVSVSSKKKIKRKREKKKKKEKEEDEGLKKKTSSLAYG